MKGKCDNKEVHCQSFVMTSELYGADIDTSSLVNEDELSRTYERNLSPEELENLATYRAGQESQGQTTWPSKIADEPYNRVKDKNQRSESVLRRTLRTSVRDFYTSADTTNSRRAVVTQSANTYQIKQSKHLPAWIWSIIITLLGVSPASRCAATFFYWFTILLAILFSAFGIVFTVYDIASSKTATTPHIGFISLLIGFGWICLGIYSFKLAGRLFENADFATSVRAHSRTFFKISSALLLIIAGIGFAVLNLYEGYSKFSPDKCSNLNLFQWVCIALYGSRAGFTVVAMVWNVMVGCVLLSVCRTHTIGIRRFVRDLEEDAKRYEDYWRTKIRRSKEGEFNAETASILNHWCVFDEEYFEMNDGDGKNVQPSTTTNQNTRTLNDRSDDVEQEPVQHVPYNFTAQISAEDSDSSVIGPFEGEVPRYPPIMTQDELLLCYWKISNRMRLTSQCLQRWVASWMAFVVIWCADYVIYWLSHPPNILGIMEFLAPLILLLLLCSAYAEANGEGQRMIRCICPTKERYGLLHFLYLQPLQMQVFGLSISYSAILTVILAFSVAFASRLILDEVKK